MNAAPPARESAAAALADLPGMAGARIVRRLAAGPTNTTWLVEREGQRWVLRQDRPGIVELGLDRQNEGRVCAAAAAAGLTPEYRVFEPGSGVCLRRFVPGRAWTAGDLRSVESLERLADVLRTLHALPPVGADFDPRAAVRRYAAQLGGRDAAALAARALDALQGTWRRDSRSALCHNDLVAENVLETDGGALMLIDWEYAGCGDPWFDLAVVIRHHELGDGLARAFLQAYLRRPATAGEQEQLTRLCRFYGDLLDLWYRRVGDPAGAETGCGTPRA